MIDFNRGVQLGPLGSAQMETARIWRNAIGIRQWCRQTGLITPDDQLDWFERQRKDSSIKMYSIFEDSRFVGVCGLTSIDSLNRRAEFSLYIGPQFHGLGLGRKALMTLVDHGFRDLNLNCIWGESFDGNPAVKMFLSIGFKKEGTRRQFYFKNGKFIDAHLFSVLAKEWK